MFKIYITCEIFCKAGTRVNNIKMLQCNSPNPTGNEILMQMTF